MQMICEIAVRSILPSIRAALAHELIAKHDMTQAQVAAKLGVTQAAISQYRQGLRGKTKNIQKEPQIASEIEQLANELVNDSLDSQKMCSICAKIRAVKGLGNCPSSY